MESNEYHLRINKNLKSYQKDNLKQLLKYLKFSDILRIESLNPKENFEDKLEKYEIWVVSGDKKILDSLYNSKFEVILLLQSFPFYFNIKGIKNIILKIENIYIVDRTKIQSTIMFEYIYEFDGITLRENIEWISKGKTITLDKL